MKERFHPKHEVREDSDWTGFQKDKVPEWVPPFFQTPDNERPDTHIRKIAETVTSPFVSLVNKFKNETAPAMSNKMRALAQASKERLSLAKEEYKERGLIKRYMDSALMQKTDWFIHGQLVLMLWAGWHIQNMKASVPPIAGAVVGSILGRKNYEKLSQKFPKLSVGSGIMLGVLAGTVTTYALFKGMEGFEDLTGFRFRAPATDVNTVYSGHQASETIFNAIESPPENVPEYIPEPYVERPHIPGGDIQSTPVASYNAKHPNVINAGAADQTYAASFSAGTNLVGNESVWSKLTQKLAEIAKDTEGGFGLTDVANEQFAHAFQSVAKKVKYQNELLNAHNIIPKSWNKIQGPVYFDALMDNPDFRQELGMKIMKSREYHTLLTQIPSNMEMDKYLQMIGKRLG